MHYLSFHLTLPVSYVNASGRIVQVSLQPGDYWTLPHGSAGQYQVVERTCAALPFGYTNSPFIWTKVKKVLSLELYEHEGFVVFGSSTTVCSLYYCDPPGRLLYSHGRLSKISSCVVASHGLPTRVYGCPLRLSQITWVWRFQQHQTPAGSRFCNGDAKIFQDQPRTSCVGVCLLDETPVRPERLELQSERLQFLHSSGDLRITSKEGRAGPKNNSRPERGPRTPVGSCENSYFRKRTIAVLLQILQMTSRILKLEMSRP